MGQVIAFDNPRRDKLRLRLLRFAREQQPVVVETVSGLHPCRRLICHDRFVELVINPGEGELFRYDQVLEATPMVPMEQMAAVVNFQIVEREPRENVLAFVRQGRTKPSRYKSLDAKR